MLQLNNINVNYGASSVLHHISLEVKKGETVVLLGANGAGKSTIFRTISGLMKPASGDVVFMDRKLTGKSPHTLVKEGIVQCPEGRKLFPQMSVYENLKMGSFVHRKHRKEVEQSLKEVYSLFPILYDKRYEAAGSLSGGQQQMLAIGRALMAKPKVLLLDEPSLGLAPLIVEQMFHIIEDINEQGTTILLAEQNANAALQISNRGYVIESGKIVLEGSKEELLSNDQIRKAYIGA